MHRIIVNCKADGEVEVKAENVLGDSCSAKTKPFIDALGERVKEIPTAEMFQEEKASENEQIATPE